LSIVLDEDFEEDSEIVFREACKLGCEGIVSGSTLSLGQVPALAEGQNPKAPAVRREAEEVAAANFVTNMGKHGFEVALI